jgi:hypothetical protein
MLTALVLIFSAAGMPDFTPCTRERATPEMRVPGEFGKRDSGPAVQAHQRIRGQVHRRWDEQSNWLYRSSAAQSRGTPRIRCHGPDQGIGGQEKRNVTEVGSKYASFRVIGIEGVEPK